MKTTACFITIFVIAFSCTSATSTPNKPSEVAHSENDSTGSIKSTEPPKEITFNRLSTARADKNAVNGLKITSTQKGSYELTFTPSALTIKLEDVNGQQSFLIKNYRKQEKHYNGGNIKKGLVYIGADATTNEYVEVEYMYTAKSIDMAVIRTGKAVAMLTEVANTNTVNNNTNKMVVGCWLMLHGGLDLQFYDNQTFYYSTHITNEKTFESRKVEVRGTYKFDGKTITLQHSNGKSEILKYYVEKMDGFGRIKREDKEGSYTYLKYEDCN